MPKAHIAFLDEIWKANPAIQNTLLTILNEKKFHNGNLVEDVPLLFFVCASNELPSKTEESLQALWDRISVRLELQRLQNHENFTQLLNAPPAQPQAEVPQPLAIGELTEWRQTIAGLRLGETATAALCHMKQKLRDHNENNAEPIFVSDHRYQQIALLIRAAAFCNGHSEPDIIDASVMLHCIWQKPEERELLDGFWHEICRAHAIASELDGDAIKERLQRYRAALEKHHIHHIKEKCVVDPDNQGFIPLAKPIRYSGKITFTAIHKDSWATLQQKPGQFENNYWRPTLRISSGRIWQNDSDTYCRIDPARTNKWQTYITQTHNGSWTGQMTLQTTQSAGNQKAGFDNQKFITANENGVVMTITENKKTLDALEAQYAMLEKQINEGIEHVKTERDAKADVYAANFFCRKQDWRLLTEPAAKTMEELEGLRLEAQGIHAEYQPAL